MPQSEQRLLYYPLSIWDWLSLGVMLVVPGWGLFHLGYQIDGRLILAALAVISTVTYLACVMDKRKAQTGRWRTSEATLHWLELMGGWPASFLAQRHFRHKISKWSYQMVFWLIVGAYQIIALDYVNDWKAVLMARDFLATLH